ncbi:MAG: hypothetical protein GY705_03140, partial [Bacteroidetes bacterium]|nr:hypothetical protein [Bacteroidota bacterium]
NSENIPIYHRTSLGGDYRWEDHENHLPFTGFRLAEHIVRNAVVGQLNIRWNITGDHYICFKSNVSFTSDEDVFLSRENWHFGSGLTYSFDSFVGPLEFTIMGNSLYEQGHTFISIGNKF